MPAKPLTPERISAIANGYWSSCALHAGVQCGVLARLESGPADAGELADELGLDHKALSALLIALLTLGVLKKGQGGYSLVTELAGCFLPGGERDLGGMVLHMADMVADWSRLHQCVRSGRLTQEKRGSETPERQNFYRAMGDIARRQAKGLAARLDIKPGTRLLDLGGGPGVYGLTFADEVPELMATVFDLPGSAEAFAREAKSHERGDEVRRINGNYREDGLGGPYETVWLSQVLHGEGPEECARLLAKAADALAPGGVLWVQEFVVDPSGQGHPFSALFALNMLINTPAGQGYTLAELTELLQGAGLGEVSWEGATKEGSPASLVRAVKPA